MVTCVVAVFPVFWAGFGVFDVGNWGPTDFLFVFPKNGGA